MASLLFSAVVCSAEEDSAVTGTSAFPMVLKIRNMDPVEAFLAAGCSESYALGTNKEISIQVSDPTTLWVVSNSSTWDCEAAACENCYALVAERTPKGGISMKLQFGKGSADLVEAEAVEGDADYLQYLDFRTEESPDPEIALTVWPETSAPRAFLDIRCLQSDEGLCGASTQEVAASQLRGSAKDLGADAEAASKTEVSDDVQNFQEVAYLPGGHAAIPVHVPGRGAGRIWVIRPGNGCISVCMAGCGVGVGCDAGCRHRCYNAGLSSGATVMAASDVQSFHYPYRRGGVAGGIHVPGRGAAGGVAVRPGNGCRYSCMAGCGWMSGCAGRCNSRCIR
jgi:hypothetical protein